MPRVKKPRPRKKVSDARRITTLLMGRFFKMGEKIAHEEDWVFFPRATRPWIDAFGNCFRKQNEQDAVRLLAYLMVWAKNLKAHGKSFSGISVDQIFAIAEADYLDRMRAFYRRNIRSIAQLYLELSAA